MACPGSIQLSSQVPPAPSTRAANEGTAAHSLAEKALQDNKEPHDYIGETIYVERPDEEPDPVEVTYDMADAVKLYTDHVRSRMAICDVDWIEKKFTLEALNPPIPMFGTSDYVGYSRAEKTLYVDDLKYGVYHVVEVENNVQTRYYGLGAILSLDPAEYPVEKIVITIVQPRASHADGPIRSETLSYAELVEFAGELIDAAHKTQEPGAPRVAGSHCKFCPASGVCPEQRALALEIAQSEFSVVEADEFVPPTPSAIPLDQFAHMLSRLPILDQWMSDMRARAHAMLHNGEEVPGFKLVEKRATREWTDEDAVIQRLDEEFADGADIFVKKLKSPAQIQKLFKGKKKFEAAMGDLVVKASSGYSMVPVTDHRPEVVLTKGHEFPALPAPDSSSTEGKEENE